MQDFYASFVDPKADMSEGDTVLDSALDCLAQVRHIGVPMSPPSSDQSQQFSCSVITGPLALSAQLGLRLGHSSCCWAPTAPPSV